MEGKHDNKSTNVPFFLGFPKVARFYCQPIGVQQDYLLETFVVKINQGNDSITEIVTNSENPVLFDQTSGH